MKKKVEEKRTGGRPAGAKRQKKKRKSLLPSWISTCLARVYIMTSTKSWAPIPGRREEETA